MKKKILITSVIPGNRQHREKNTKPWSPFCTDHISKVLARASKQDYTVRNCPVKIGEYENYNSVKVI